MKIAIVTRNGIHGGVETLIAIHQKYFRADVFVAGGINQPETCPFSYTYISATDVKKAQQELVSVLRDYDVIEYHWLPSWAVEAIFLADKPSVEVVHRTDTSDCDKSVPTFIITHSHYLADFIQKTYGRSAVVIPNAIEVNKFPEKSEGKFVGAITSYYQTKGIDIFLKAWSKVQQLFPNVQVRFYGAGDDLPLYKQMISDLGLKNVELLGPVSDPENHITEFKLFVVPSRVEGFPMTILEALACNIPVLASALPGIVEFKELSKNRGFNIPLFLFRPEDADDLAVKLIKLLSSLPHSSSGRAYISQYYNAEDHCRAYLIVFGRAIERFESFAPYPLPKEMTTTPPFPTHFANWEVEELHWLAYAAHRLRHSRWYPTLRKIAKFFL